MRLKFMRIVALAFDCAGLGLSVLAKYSAVKTGNVAESAKADEMIQEGIKRVKRDISGSF